MLHQSRRTTLQVLLQRLALVLRQVARFVPRDSSCPLLLLRRRNLRPSCSNHHHHEHDDDDHDARARGGARLGRALRVGIGGPVGTGKTSLVAAL